MSVIPDKVSTPYAPTMPAPLKVGLHKLLEHTVTADGHYHCGKLEFESKREYQTFSRAQTRIGGTPEQLAILYQIETTGKIPRIEPTKPAPPGATVETLLDLHGQKPDAHGFYHLGSLRVLESEFKRFATVQRDACKTPEGLSQLYHMQHEAGSQPLKYRVFHGGDRNDHYDPNTNQISIDDTTAIRDAKSGKVLTVGDAAVHEQAHALGRKGIRVLQGIPCGDDENMEEKRVIRGAEFRTMAQRKRAPRDSHYGWVLNVDGVDSSKPVIDSRDAAGNVTKLRSPLELSGTVGPAKGDWTTLHVAAEGTKPAYDIELKTEHLALCTGGDTKQGKAVLGDARLNKDTVTLWLTDDGRMLYDSPTQDARLAKHHTGLQLPDNMHAVTQRDRVRESAGIER